MAALQPREGNIRAMTDFLGGGSLENWTLDLYKSNTTPSETDTVATYTLADFTGYAGKTLTRSVGASQWNTPTNTAPTGWTPSGTHTQVGHSQYGSAAQSWTCGATGNTIYGYIIRGATNNKLMLAEKFGTARTLADTDVLNLQPIWEMA